MKSIHFEGNTPTCAFTYHRVHEGPNFFISFYKNSSRMHYDPKDCWRTLGVAKFTETGKALKQWCIDTFDKYNKSVQESGGEAGAELGRKDTSFASEVLLEEAEESPTDNTRMVT